MGSRKYNAAEARKEARKSVAMASLNNCPTSPRKMRLVADLIRGIEVQPKRIFYSFGETVAFSFEQLAD